MSDTMLIDAGGMWATTPPTRRSREERDSEDAELLEIVAAQQQPPPSRRQRTDAGPQQQHQQVQQQQQQQVQQQQQQVQQQQQQQQVVELALSGDDFLNHLGDADALLLAEAIETAITATATAATHEPQQAALDPGFFSLGDKYAMNGEALPFTKGLVFDTHERVPGRHTPLVAKKIADAKELQMNAALARLCCDFLLTGRDTAYLVGGGGGGQGEPYLVMEKATDGDLFTLVQRGALSPEDFRQLALCIVNGVKAMHDGDYAHLDIKPENVLIFSRDNGTKIARLVDFGSTFDLAAPPVATDQPPRMVLASKIVGTAEYSPPEIFELQREPVHPKPVDIWELGATLFCMIKRTFVHWLVLDERTGRTEKLFDKRRAFALLAADATNNSNQNSNNNNNNNNSSKNNKLRIWLPLDQSKPEENLIHRMLSFKPEDRPTIDQVRADEFFMQKS